MSNALLPCPFCGSDAKCESAKHGELTLWDAVCTDHYDCGARVSGLASEESAIMVWNKRMASHTLTLLVTTPSHEMDVTGVAVRLSPCKHCGGAARINKGITDSHLCWSVACQSCGITTAQYSQQDDAVAAWQRVAYQHRNGETVAPWE